MNDLTSNEFNESREDNLDDYWMRLNSLYNMNVVDLLYGDYSHHERVLSKKIGFNLDELTGLYTRKYFEMEIQKRIQTGIEPISVIMLDINGLKVINDTYGHHIGDMILTEIGGCLRTLSNLYDCCARWGGDEIVILMDKTDEQKAQRIVKLLMKTIDDKKKFEYNISYGWATEYGNLALVKLLVKRAEDKMFSNKLWEPKSIRSNMINTIMNALHLKNLREEIHSLRVSSISERIAGEMGFSDYEVIRVKTAGLLHDIGKIAINEGILNKPGKLDHRERDEIQKHTEYGFRILSTSKDLLEISNSVLTHHEHWDGQGYPKRISKKNIPIMARIIAVADVFDAITSERPYRKAMSEKQAIEEIKNGSGTQFDPEVVEAFLRLYT